MRPVDENQKADLADSKEIPIEYVEISDELVIEGLLKHWRQSKEKIEAWRVKILFRGGELSFLASPQEVGKHSLKLMLCSADG
jgi:hypothetical protein